MEKMQEAKEGPGTQWKWGPHGLPWALLWSINRKVEWEVGYYEAESSGCGPRSQLSLRLS